MENSNIKDVFGYEGLYSIDEKGNVYSKRSWRGVKNRILIPSKNEYGYLRVFLTKNGNTKGITLHKLMATTFLGERKENMQVRHLDGNKDNNNLSNLIYGTALENAKDRKSHLKTAFGEKIGTSKLSNQDVVDIRNSTLSQKELSKIYKVSIANISMIINYKSRKNG
jgi:hypothetical protein